jgi:hypothetical protein
MGQHLSTFLRTPIPAVNFNKSHSLDVSTPPSLLQLVTQVCYPEASLSLSLSLSLCVYIIVCLQGNRLPVCHVVPKLRKTSSLVRRVHRNVFQSPVHRMFLFYAMNILLPRHGSPECY